MKLSPQSYVKNEVDRAIIAATASFFVSAFLGVLKLFLGIWYRSPWFISNAFYYILLSAARGQSIRKYILISSLRSRGDQLLRQIEVYRHSGALICLVGVSYLLVCLRMYFVGDSLVYRGYIVYGVAFAAAIKIGFSVSGMLAAARLKSPIFSALKTLNLIDATVSIVVAVGALLELCHDPFAYESSAILGIASSLCFLLSGAWMIYKGKRSQPVKNRQ